MVSLNIRNLLDKANPFWSIDAHKMEIFAVENSQGQLNWDTEVLSESPPEKSEKSNNIGNLLSFETIKLTQASLEKRTPIATQFIDINSLSLKQVSDASVELSGSGIYQDTDIKISGKVEIEKSGVAEPLVQFSMLANALDVDFHANGHINPENIGATKISVNAKSDDLGKLQEFLQSDFSPVSPVDVSMDFAFSKGIYEASNIDFRAGENILHGDVVVDSNESTIRASLLTDKLDLSPFITKNVDKDSESETELPAGKDKTSESELDWTWMNALNLELALQAKQIVANQHILNTVDGMLKIKDRTIELEKLKLVYHSDDNSELGKPYFSEPIAISGVFQPFADNTLGRDAKLLVALSEGDTKLELQGDVNLNGVAGNALKVDVSADKLALLSNLTQFDFDSYLPLRLSGMVETSVTSASVKQFKADFGQSDISVEMDIDWAGDLIKLEGEVASKLLDLSSFVTTPDNKNHDEVSADVDGDTDVTKVISDSPIDWGWLRKIDSSLKLNVEKLIVLENELDQIVSNIETSDGKLNIDPIDALFADGSVQVILSLKEDAGSVKLNTQLNLADATLAGLGFTGDTVLSGGIVQLDLNLSGQGRSLHEIASTLNGEATGIVQKAIIKNDAFEIIGSDVFLELLNAINPFVKDDETTELECARIRFSAQEGVLTSDKELAIETSKIKIIGGGTIDLSTEELQIGFSPIAKKGIGVNAGSLVKFVRLGGTLSNPHPEADPLGVLKSSAAIGTAISTGGISLLAEGLFKRATNAGSACDQEDDVAE